MQKKQTIVNFLYICLDRSNCSSHDTIYIWLFDRLLCRVALGVTAWGEIGTRQMKGHLSLVLALERTLEMRLAIYPWI